GPYLLHRLAIDRLSAELVVSPGSDWTASVMSFRILPGAAAATSPCASATCAPGCCRPGRVSGGGHSHERRHAAVPRTGRRVEPRGNRSPTALPECLRPALCQTKGGRIRQITLE